MGPMSAQPGIRAGGNPPATSSQVALMSAQLGISAACNPPATSSQVALMSALPGTMAGGDSISISSTSIDFDIEQQVRNMFEHQHWPCDDGIGEEEEPRVVAPR